VATCGIYKITNELDNKCYIGSSMDVQSRLCGHLRLLKNNTHSNAHLQRAWNCDGEEVFRCETIEECAVEVILQRESAWIEHYKSWDRQFGYNLDRNPQRPIHSEETKQKISQACRGLSHGPMSDEHKKKIGDAGRKTKASEETRAKLRNSQRGRAVIMTEDGKDVRFDKILRAAEYINDKLAVKSTVRVIATSICTVCQKKGKSAYGRQWRYE
jgi:group I intron endonuclease